MNLRFKFVHTLNNLLFNKMRFFGSRKIGRFISKVLLPSYNEEVLIPTIYNFDLFVSPNTGKEIYNLGFYEVGTLNVIKHCLNESSCFIDVGASIGLISVYGSQINTKGKTLSFEPSAERYAILGKNIAINKLSHVQAFNCGLGEEKSVLKLNISRYSPSIVEYEESDNFEEIRINVLDEVLIDQKIDRVDFIKIDVEGFESQVLAGARDLLESDFAPMLCVEYVRKLQTLNGVKSIFEEILGYNSYRIFVLQKGDNTISKLVEVKDEKQIKKDTNIFCFTERHLSKIAMELFVNR